MLIYRNLEYVVQVKSKGVFHYKKRKKERSGEKQTDFNPNQFTRFTRGERHESCKRRRKRYGSQYLPIIKNIMKTLMLNMTQDL